MAKRVGVVEATLRLDGKQWEESIRRATSQATEFVTDTTVLMAGLGTSLLDVSATLGAVTIGLKGAGDKALDLRKNLAGAFSGAELDGVAKQISEISALELKGLDTDELIEGAKRLNTFSDEVAADLERVANVSAKTGESFGSLKDYFAEFTINQEAQETLKEIANITPEKLVAFGATLDATGEKIRTTGKYAESAQKALRAVVDSEYGGAVYQMASNTDLLNQKLTLLSQQSGTAVATLADDVAGVLAPLVGGFTDFVGKWGPAIGILTGVGAAMAGIGAAAIGVVLAGAALETVGGTFGALLIVEQVVAKIGIVSLPLLAKSAALAAASFAFLLGAGAGLILLFAQTTKAIEQQTAAEEALLKIEQERGKWAKTAGDFQGKTTEELAKQGKTAKGAAQAILGLQERIEAARRAGNEGMAETLERQVADLQRTKRELSVLEKDQRDKEKVEDPFSFNKPKTLDQEQERIAYLRAQNKITEREELELKKRALDFHKADDKAKRALAIETAKFETDEKAKAAEAGKKADEDGFKVEMDRIKLLATQKKISREQELQLEEQALKRFGRGDDEKRALIQRRAEQDAGDRIKWDQKVEKARAGQVSERLEDIQLLRTQEKISADQQIKAYDDVLAHYNLTEAEKVSILQKRADVEKSIRDKKLAAEKKAADESLKIAEKNADDIAKAQEKARDLKDDSVDREIADVATATEFTGAGSQDALREMFEEQERLKVESIQAEADKLSAATKSAEARAQIEANAQEAIRQEQLKTVDSYQAALGRQTDAVQKYAESLTKESSVTGKDNSSKIKAALQQQLDLEAAIIRMEADKAKAAVNSAQERAQIEARAQAQIRAEQFETAEAYQAALDKQAKALEDHEKKKKKRLSSESSFGSFGIEDLADRLNAEKATTRRGRDSGPSLSSFVAASSFVSPRRADDIGGPASAKSRSSSDKKIGSIDINVTQTSKGGLADVSIKTTGFDGNMSETFKQGRGMKGRVGVR